MIEKLTTKELEQFNYLIKVIYLGVMNDQSKIEPYTNAIETVNDKIGNVSYVNIMEVLEKDGYTKPCPNPKSKALVLTDKGLRYAKNTLNLKCEK